MRSALRDALTAAVIVAMRTQSWRRARRRTWLCLGLGLLSGLPAQAGTDLEPVFVTAASSERGRSATDVDLRAYTGFSRSIQRADFSTRFVAMSELLDTLPGVQVRRSGGLGAASDISLRASTGKQVNVYLDGLLLNDPGSGATHFQQIPAVLVDRVTAYPDFTPVQLGNANIAGAVDFVTRSMPAESRGGELQAAYGSFGTRNLEASSWGRLGAWELIAAANHTRADNDFPVGEGQFATTSRRRINDDFAQDGVLLKAERDSEGFGARALLQFSDADKGLPTTRNRRVDNARLLTRATRMQGVLDHRIGALDIGHRLFVSQRRQRFDDREATVGLGPDLIDSDLDGFGVFSTATLWRGAHQLALSVDLRRDDITKDDLLEKERLVDARRDTLIISASEEWTPSSRWRLSAVGRLHIVDDDVRQIRPEREADDQVREPSAQLGLQWQASEQISWKANLGWQLRVPTLDEKFGARGLFTGAPELDPERGLSADTGFELRVASLRVQGSIFARRVSDTIVTVFNSRGIGRAQNVGDSMRVGLEGEVGWQPWHWLELRSDVTLIDSENRSIIASARGQRLPGIYHRSYGLGVTVHGALLSWRADYRQQEALFYDSANRVRADDKKELSSALTLNWQRYTLDLAARNLLDRNFLDINRFPTPGRSLRATLTIAFF